MKMYTEQQMQDIWDAAAIYACQVCDYNRDKRDNITVPDRDQYLSTVKPVEVMRWIKASERLPEAGCEVTIRFTNQYGSTLTDDCGGLDLLKQWMSNDQYKNNIEWLDESPIPLSAFDKFKVSGPHLDKNPFYTLRKTDLEGIIGKAPATRVNPDNDDMR